MGGKCPAAFADPTSYTEWAAGVGGQRACITSSEVVTSWGWPSPSGQSSKPDHVLLSVTVSLLRGLNFSIHIPPCLCSIPLKTLLLSFP